MMRAIRVETFGGSEVLMLQQVAPLAARMPWGKVKGANP
jgi:hypothetical protein